jgi:hypothetical protein
VRIAVGTAVLLFAYIELFIYIHKPLRDLRDLLAVLALVGGVAIVSPIRRHIMSVPSRRLGLWIVLCAITPFGIVLGVRGALDLTPMAVLVERDLTLIEPFEDGLPELYAPREDPTELNVLAFARAADAARLHHALALFEDIDLALP